MIIWLVSYLELGYCETGKTRLNLTTGRTLNPVGVFSFTERTIPSCPGKVSTTLARGHSPRGVKSSNIQTMSSGCKLEVAEVHFDRFC